MRKSAVDVHLIRPGETRSHAADVGLTARGEGQCRRGRRPPRSAA